MAKRKGRKTSARVGRTAKGRIKPGFYLACDTGRITKAKGKKSKARRRRR